MESRAATSISVPKDHRHLEQRLQRSYVGLCWLKTVSQILSQPLISNATQRQAAITRTINMCYLHNLTSYNPKESVEPLQSTSPLGSFLNSWQSLHCSLPSLIVLIVPFPFITLAENIPWRWHLHRAIWRETLCTSNVIVFFWFALCFCNNTIKFISFCFEFVGLSFAVDLVSLLILYRNICQTSQGIIYSILIHFQYNSGLSLIYPQSFNSV